MDEKHYICTRFGTIAQLVEQRTENPCVVGSIPTGTTKKRGLEVLFFVGDKMLYLCKIVEQFFNGIVESNQLVVWTFKPLDQVAS